MKIENGLLGTISYRGTKLPVDGWDINHKLHIAAVHCDLRAFCDQYELSKNRLHKLVETDWLFRLDNEDHIYHGIGRINTVARKLKVSRPYPKIEFFRNNIVIVFRMVTKCYGPYHVAEALAMARNGNDMFFDLLPLTEIEEKVKSGDPRFSNNI